MVNEEVFRVIGPGFIAFNLAVDWSSELTIPEIEVLIIGRA